jgi:hypothetical protein
MREGTPEPVQDMRQWTGPPHGVSQLHLPMRKPKDVIPYLGSPGGWKHGRSAKLIAKCWFEAEGLPEMIRHTLNRCPPDQVSSFANAQLVDAFLERRTELGDGLRPSQSDVLAIVRLPNELAVMVVEGKVDESFGPLVSEWLRDAAPRSGKLLRLKSLAETLGIAVSVCKTLRYQLLHRTASAIYEARRYHAEVAIMMVHSFDPHDAGFEDFARFAAAMGNHDAAATRVVGPVMRDGIAVYLGWTADRPSNVGYTVVDGRKTDAGIFEND